ncbi:MAG: PAS domain S-box protein [Desulfosudaceae bacterium]
MEVPRKESDGRRNNLAACPVSGLPITGKPEWTNIKLSDTYQVTFKFIGDRILFVIPSGSPEKESVAALFRHRQDVIREMIGEKASFVELTDASGVNDVLTRSVRQQTANGYLNDRHRLLGFIVINAPIKIRLALNVGKRLFRNPFPVLAVKNYETGATRALFLLNQDQPHHQGLLSATTRKKEWQLRSKRGTIEVELVNGNIIYCENSGDVSEEEVLASLEVMGKLAASLAGRTSDYYLVVVPQLSRLSRGNRNHYINFLNDLHARQPFRAFILCRANRFFRTVLYLARPRLNFPAWLARDFEDALRMINQREILSDEEDSAWAPMIGQAGQGGGHRLINDLLDYLGRINWEVEGPLDPPRKSDRDPLKPVYDAIDLIKSDVDDLFYKRQQARQALSENIERQTGIIESLNDGYYECDLPGNATLVNQALCEMFGYTRNEMLGMNYRDYMDEETAAYIKKKFNEVYRTGQANRSLEYKIFRKNGSSLFVDVSVTLIRDNRGRATGFRGIIRDITERRQNEEQLKMFRRFIESSGEGVGWSDLEGRVVYANSTMARILGEDSQDQLRGKYVTDYYDKETREWMEHSVLPVVHRQGEWKGEMTVQNKKGLQISTLNDIFFIEDDSGHVRYHATITRDISDLKKAEQALRESEEKYRLLVNNASDAICIAQDEVLKFVNPRLVALLEYSPMELSSRSFIDFIHPEDSPLLRDIYLRRIKGEQAPGTYSFRVFTKSGRMLWMQNNAVRITWDGRPAILNFIRDITLQKNMEEQLRHSVKMEAIGTLAGGIAHDFNNILAAIMGYTEVIMGETLDGTRSYRNLRQIRKAVMRARELVRQILTFSRPGEESLKSLQLAPIVKEVLKMIQATAPANIEIERDIAAYPVNVMADPTQIHEVVMNLCANAIQAMGEGGRLLVSLAVVELDNDNLPGHKDVSPGQFARMVIKDSGAGMPPEVGERVFEPYFTTRPHGEGTGLGLSVVHGIVDSLGGGVEMSSQVNAGTTFRIYLPIIDAAEKEWEEVSTDTRLPGGEGLILLVDNDPQLVDSGRQLLEQLGYRVETATDARIALDLLGRRAAAFNLVISDMVMPKMSGAELALEIYKIRSDLPVILCSGNDTRISNIEETMIQKCLNKPFVARDLAWAVRDVLDKAAANPNIS